MRGLVWRLYLGVGALARRSGVECSVQVDLNGRLDGELETVVYRVTQEAVLNVARHAEAGVSG